MPRFYQYAAVPTQYNAVARTYRQNPTGAEARSLGDRYTGPVVEGDLGKLNVYGYAGGQDLGNYVSNFGGQNKDLGAFLPTLTTTQKYVIAAGVVGVVAYLALGKK